MSTNGHVDPRAVAKEMTALLWERLNDPEERPKISNAVAAKYGDLALKLAALEQAEQEDKVVAPTDVLDIIQGSDIDIGHKDLLVNREIARLEEKLLLLRAAKEDRYGERRGLLQGEQADEERGILVFQPVAV